MVHIGLEVDVLLLEHQHGVHQSMICRCLEQRNANGVVSLGSNERHRKASSSSGEDQAEKTFTNIFSEFFTKDGIFRFTEKVSGAHRRHA